MSNLIRKFRPSRNGDGAQPNLAPPEDDDEGALSDSSYHPQPTQRSATELSDPAIGSPLSLFPSLPTSFRPHRLSDASSRFPGMLDFPAATPRVEDHLPPSDSLGLNLLHSPDDPTVDFIFIHGLSGSSRGTWLYHKDPQTFWPLWLPREPELSGARIFTFGYNSKFQGASTSLNMTDFAKDLLVRMLTFSESAGDGAESRLGENPIIFVTHSMGGLIAKKAYILGKHDEQYSSLMKQVQGIAFLATPHRGASYARILNAILEASPFGTSKKEYVSDLDTSSSNIQDINEQFRIHSNDLVLISFYETIKTNFRGVNRIIVDRGSAVLDYPQEQSSPLNATHHNICKFESPRDENYSVVKNMLKLVVSRLVPKKARADYLGPVRPERQPSNAEAAKRLEDILGVHEPPENDLNLLKSHIAEGSCEWILRKQSFLNWAFKARAAPSFLWLTGPPAAGKSTLSSFIIDWIRTQYHESSCQFYFFFSDHQRKKTIAHFLRAIAFQLAQSHEIFQEALLNLNDETDTDFGEQKASLIWERIFEGILFRVPLNTEMFWVFDALDEADEAASLCHMLLRSRSPANRIRILITSRPTKELSSIINGHPAQITHEPMTAEDTSQDIRAYVTQTVCANFPQDEETQNTVIQQILDKANGSFLWVKLTLETISDSWHTKDDIRKAMTYLPEGMEPLYQRMLQDVLDQAERIRDMAQEILTWAVCSYRPLRISELEEALLPKYPGFVSLEETINQVCGHFLRTKDGQIALVHATARHFLLHKSNGFIDKRQSHEHLALACLQYLSDEKENWRSILAFRPKGIPATDRVRLKHYADEYPLLNYAVEHWAFHVNKASGNSELMEALGEFFFIHLLTWINAVILTRNLRILSRTAQYIRGFVRRKVRQQPHPTEPPTSMKIEDLQWLRLWATDLIRLMGRFGRTLLREPKSIYRHVPIMCPAQSQLGLTYGRSSETQMSLSGLSKTSWDDCLARVGVSDDDSICRVATTETYFLTLLSVTGVVVIWSAETCEELRRVSHGGEYVTHMSLNKRGTLLVTAGIRTIRAWEISTGKETSCFPRNNQARTMAVAFGELDDSIIIAREDFTVQTCALECGDITKSFWAFSQSLTAISGPKFMELSPDLNKVAVAMRGRPVLVWDLERSENQQPYSCVRAAEAGIIEQDEASWTPAEIARWHPDGTSLFLLYSDTTIVHWNFIEDIQREYSNTDARDMVVSKDASFIITSSARGTISVWAMPRFNLVYKLFYEELVRDIAFSPDGQRIYDSRGSHVNIWEPDVLLPHEDAERDDDTSSNCDGNESSTLLEPVVAQDDRDRVKVRALARDAPGKYYCCGNNDGSVAIHDATNGKRLRKVYSHSNYVSITVLEWSETGKYMVSSDDAGKVICKRLEPKEDVNSTRPAWAVFPVFSIRVEEPILQFLFDPSETLLLISTISTDILWSIKGKGKREVARRTWPYFMGRRWITHPQDSTQLLWIDPTNAYVFTWQTLELLSSNTGPATEPAPDSDVASGSKPIRPHLSHTVSGSPSVIRCISATRYARHLLVEVVPYTGTSRSVLPRGLEAYLIHLNPPLSPDPIVRRTALPALAAQSARLLGFYQGRVLYFNRTFWICSWNLAEIDSRAAKRHFFLPRDWVTPGNIALLMRNVDGTVFCPRDGEVAIVRNGIRF